MSLSQLILEADLHIHTVASGHAYSTVLEIAQFAKEKGLKLIAITDHGPSMPGGPHLYHFGNLRVLPRFINEVEVLKGVEANIIDQNGGIDMPKGYLRKLDIVLAGMHSICSPEGTVEENTRAYINAMKNPYIDIIVHPGNPEYLIDPEQVVAAAKEAGVALEINNSSLTGSRRGGEHNCEVIARLAAKAGINISIGSDCHFAPFVGESDSALDLCLKAGINENQIINRTVETVREFLQKRKEIARLS